MSDRSMLLVEGHEDKHVFVHLLGQHDIPLKPPYGGDDKSEAVYVRDVNGIDNLLDDISVRLKGTGSGDLQRLGLVVDADLNIMTRWQSVRDRLIKAGYDTVLIPDEPDPMDTVIVQSSKPTVGVWIMPNNQIPGILEDFIEFLIPEQDLLWASAKDCVAQIPEQLRLFRHTKKAEIHTWLAWQEEPGTPMGQAITKTYLKGHNPQAQQLIQWIRRVFSTDVRP